MPGFRRFANRYSVGAASAFSMQVLGAALSFLFSLLLAKLIGADGLGLFFLGVTSVEICSTVSRLGLENAALKFISIAHADGDRALLATLYRKCIGIAAFAAAALALPASLILGLIPVGGSHHAEFQALVPYLMAALIPATILTVQAEAFRAVGYPGTAVFAQSVLPQGALLAFGAVLAWQGYASANHVMASYVAAFALAAVFALICWASIVKGFWRKAAFPTTTLLRTSLPMLAVSSLNLFIAWTDTLVLGILSDTNQVGIYGVALRFSSTTAFVLVAVNSVVAREFAALHSSGRLADLERMAQRGAFWTLAIASPLILIFLVFPAQILALFGEQFLAGTWPLRLLALAQLVNVLTGQVSSLLIMTGHEKWLRNNIAFSATANLAGNLVLVPLLGALGAAISTAFCISLMQIISWWLVRRKLNIDTIGYLNPFSHARAGPG
jgi:O-antigen/teichoic acid export membrane protein